ncbi:MAG: hypothetical protein JOZ55_03070 [Alphaproteobacteria bacterium]|nr:hypothetical protein [Alphaproteobacteria bacterium]
MSFRFFLALLLAVPAAAKFAPPSFVDERGLSEAERYQRCLDETRSDASTAYEQALAWHDAGGGAAAVHCSALALVQLKQYAEAAFKLDQLAHSPESGEAGLRAELLDQAGNAWMLAGQSRNAEAALSAAIDLDPSADSFGDRARARAQARNWTGAETDLGVALSKDSFRADFLVLRASARHALGKKKEARDDIEQALRIDPHYADALVERGGMKLEEGDRAGARADWQIVLATQPKSAAADSARARIEALELRKPRRAHRSTRP